MKKNSYIYTIMTRVMDFMKGQDPMKTMDTGMNGAIHEWLSEMNITEYKISEDFVISAFNKIDISEKNIKNIPYKFYEISGGFYCSDNNLKTLENVPTIINNGSFICTNNLLENLIGGPQIVDGYYVVSNNKLSTLDGIAEKIQGTLAIDNNLLTSLKGCPEIIHGDFYCQHNDLKNLSYFPKKINGTLYISYTEDFKKKKHLFINKIHKICSVEEIKIM